MESTPTKVYCPILHPIEMTMPDCRGLVLFLAVLLTSLPLAVCAPARAWTEHAGPLGMYKVRVPDGWSDPSGVSPYGGHWQVWNNSAEESLTIFSQNRIVEESSASVRAVLQEVIEGRYPGFEIA